MYNWLYLLRWIISVTAILRKLKQQSRESVEDKRPKLLKALREVRTTLWCCHRAANSVFSSSSQSTAFSYLTLNDFFPHTFSPLCSSETFIWSCTGTFRAGVSFHTLHRIHHLCFLLGSLSSFLPRLINFLLVVQISAFVVQDASIRRL